MYFFNELTILNRIASYNLNYQERKQKFVFSFKLPLRVMNKLK